jgi:hypothetical protein
VGTHVSTLCNLIYGQQGEVGVRRTLLLLPLALMQADFIGAHAARMMSVNY